MSNRNPGSYQDRLWARVEEKMRASVAQGRPPLDFSEAFEDLDRQPNAAELLVDEPPSGGPE